MLIADFDDMCDEIRKMMEERSKLLEFVERTSINIVHSEFMADKVRERAIKLLKEIGELDE